MPSANPAHPKLSSATAFNTEVTLKIPLSYQHFNAGEGKPLLLFFHGYTDTAAGFLRRTFPELDTKYEILAPNGPFPLPQKIDNGWRQAFAWYFAEFSNSSVVIHPDVAAKAVQQLLQELKLEDRAKILVGFSQGGFFIPFVLPQLRNVKKIFAIGSAYRPEAYSHPLNIPLDAIHGTADEVISYDKSKESFELFKTKNPQGVFHSIEGLAHTMNDAARNLLKEKIAEIF